MIADLVRSATAEAHAELEGTLPLMDLALTLSQYRAIVGRFLGFIEPLEESVWAVRGISATGLVEDQRRKAYLLRTDLGRLGLRDAEIHAVPRATHLPRIESVPAAMGALYVTEGSTLGGQLIKRHLMTTLGVERDSGAAYFSGYGQLTGRRWKEFLAALENIEQTDADKVVASAVETFACLGMWLTLAATEIEGARSLLAR
ncbi:MAG: biliverdin-producing heme oxygenase [Gemmatimonadaceae bacterium]